MQKVHSCVKNYRLKTACINKYAIVNFKIIYKCWYPLVVLVCSNYVCLCAQRINIL